MTAAVRAEGLVQIHVMEGAQVVALRSVDLVVETGETVALLGPSGSGKSTLLTLLAGLQRPTAGTLLVLGRDMSRLTERELLSFRAKEVGVVLQDPRRNLLPYATVAGNVGFAQQSTRGRASVKRQRTAEVLAAVGLEGRARVPAAALSGGEQQRLAVAVAVANGPQLLLADEPTSQLDDDAAAEVVELLRRANEDLGVTVVVVTHAPEVGSALGRTVTIRDGRVGAEGRAGEEFAVVGRDGTLQLPQDVLDLLPPGSLTQVVRGDDEVVLRRVQEP
jgi:ABC-type lipoprotein export system ATPase subunit